MPIVIANCAWIVPKMGTKKSTDVGVPDLLDRAAGAHDAYLRGRHLWKQRTEASLRKAISEFRRAIELDSLYAEAWSGLADSYFGGGRLQTDRRGR